MDVLTALSMQRLALAARATCDVIRDWDVARGTVWLSEALTGWGHTLDQNAEVAASWWDAHIHPDDVARVRASLERAFRSNDERWSAEYRFRRGDGTYGFVLERALLIRLEDGTVSRLVAAVEDVSTRVGAEQVRRLNALGRIAATMAHDFNNVLMGIQPFAEVVRRRTIDPRITQAASQILKSVARGRRITLDLLHARHMAAPTLQEVELGAWLRRAAVEISALMTNRIDLQVHAPDDPLFASCDPAQLQQVLVNLAMNAHDAMRDGGTLTIALEAADTFVELTVRDTGSGIAPEVLPHIFEPLFTTKSFGTGLGLSVVQQIIAHHGGTLSVESSQAQGTELRIRLPRIVRAVVTKTAAHARPLERILLVEDDEVVAEGLTQLLGLQGLHVDLVTHGALVVEAVERLAPQAVVLDLVLPDINGVEVYERIAARWPELPVIFSSGNAGMQQLTRYLERPNVRFLQKPYDVDALMRMLWEIV